MKTLYIRHTVLLLISFLSLNNAAEEVTLDIVEISINSGYYNFDEGWELKSAGYLGWGLGIQVNKKWRTLLNYSRMVTGDTKDVDGLKIQKYQGDVVYTFNTSGTLRPYLVASYGEIDLTVPNGSNGQKQDEQVGLGLGLTYAISPKVFIHSELHSYYSHRRYNVDTEGKIMIAYRFGKGEK